MDTKSEGWIDRVTNTTCMGQGTRTLRQMSDHKSIPYCLSDILFSKMVTMSRHPSRAWINGTKLGINQSHHFLASLACDFYKWWREANIPISIWQFALVYGFRVVCFSSSNNSYLFFIIKFHCCLLKTFIVYRIILQDDSVDLFTK